MGLKCGARIAKVFVFIFNVLFFITGAALLGVGLWIKFDQSSILRLANMGLQEVKKGDVENYVTSTSLLEIGAYVLIGVGALTFLVGFCGCCGAIKESNCLLYTYTIFLGLFLLVQITGAVLCFVYQNKIENKVKDTLYKSLQDNYAGLPASYDAISQLWDTAMVEFKCCGITNVTDFNKADQWQSRKFYFDDKNRQNYTTEVIVPVTCCKTIDKNLLQESRQQLVSKSLINTECPVKGIEYNKEGCYDKVVGQVKLFSLVIIAVVVSVVLVELLGVIMACCLISAIHDD